MATANSTTNGENPTAGDLEPEDMTLMEAERDFIASVTDVVTFSKLELVFTSMDLEFVPEEIGKMVSLQALNLSKNLLMSIPDSIASLSNLTVLSLAGNRLSNLPDSIGALVNLGILDVSKNDLVELPDSLCNCLELKELNLMFNKLSTLPKRLTKSLNNLQKLNLGFNAIENLPEDIGHLTELTRLNTRFNRLKSVPSSIGGLSKLQFLDLSNNFADLVSLPASIGNLFSLKELDLSNNQIKILPLELGQLSQLDVLSLDGNPLDETTLGFVQKRNQPLLMEYLQQRMKAAAEQETNSTAVFDFGNWIRQVWGTEWDLAAFLRSFLAGAQSSGHLTFGSTSASGGEGRTTEMSSLLSEAEADLEGGSHGQLPVSTIQT